MIQRLLARVSVARSAVARLGRRGAGGIEYALIVGLIAVAVIGVVANTGNALSTLFCKVSLRLENATGGGVGCGPSAGTYQASTSVGAGPLAIPAAALIAVSSGSGLTVTAVGTATGGAAALSGGTVTYTPPATPGGYSFPFTVADYTGATAGGLVVVTVSSGISAAYAASGTVYVPQTLAAATVAAASSGGAGPYTLTAISSGSNCTASLAGGTITLTPGNLTGTCSYTVADTVGATATGTLSLTAVYPTACGALHSAAASLASGTYTVRPSIAPAAFPVYCDMVTNGGGWTLIAKNTATTTFTTFNQSWATYKAGFGSTASNGMGWLGNDYIHQLTASGTAAMVSYVRSSDSATILNNYSNFSVDTAANLYKLTAASSADDDGSLAYASGHPFSTYDSDNDSYNGNCASIYATGWWHNACYYESIAGNDSGQVYWRNAAQTVVPVNAIAFYIK